MKKIFVVALLISVSISAFPQVVDNKIHKIVMQFLAGDSLAQRSVVTQLNNIRASWPQAKIEVVCHSGGLDLLVTSKSKVAGALAELSSQGIVFAACNNTMRRRNLNKEDLLPVSQVVTSGMLQLVTRQEEGWAYVKGGN